MKNCNKILLCLILIFLVSFGVYGKRLPQLTIMTENFPPFNYSVNNRLVGISTEVVKKIISRLGIKAEIKEYPWARAYQKIQYEKNTVLYSMSKTKKRENLFKWVGPVVEYDVVFFKKRGRKIPVYNPQNLEDLKKARGIGIIINSSGYQILESKGFKNLDPTSNYDTNPKKLMLGRMDLWMVGYVTGLYRAKRLGFDTKDFEIAFKYGKEVLYIAFSKSTDDYVIKAWQETLDEIKKDGTYQNIVDKYID